MTAYQANRSTTQTLTGTAADQVTLTQRWGAVRITNLHPSIFLWVSPDSDVAVAEAAGTIPVPPNSSRVIDVAHVTNARTMILGIVGNGNQYTVEGMFGSQAEVLSALADEVAEGLGNAYTPGGTDVAVADGGTGASTAGGARTNLGAADDTVVVKLTGDQSVAGIKTFTSSPVIPAPTTDLQAATKKYVDDSAGASFRGARAFRSGVQSIPNATVTVVALNGESFDTNTLHDTVTNNSRIVLDTVGYWLVVGRVSWAANGTGGRLARINRNGVVDAEGDFVAALTGDVTQIGVTAVVRAAAVTDYVELAVYQNSGGALDISDAAHETFLSAHFLGA